MKTPDELFSLSPLAGILHALTLALLSSLWGALILRFAVNKVTGIKLKYFKAYLYNFIIAAVVISVEFIFIYKITSESVLTASDFIAPGNWFSVLCAVGLAIFMGTVGLGYLIKDERKRKIGTNKSFAVSLVYAAIFVPIGLVFRALYFFILEQQGGAFF